MIRAGNEEEESVSAGSGGGAQSRSVRFQEAGCEGSGGELSGGESDEEMRIFSERLLGPDAVRKRKKTPSKTAKAIPKKKSKKDRQREEDERLG